MKKRFFSVLLALVLLLCAVPLPVHAAANEITVYNWGQYISDGTDDCLDVIAAFEEETGIKVNYLTFDSNESMYTKLKTGGTTFDVIIPSDYMIAKLISEDMLEPLDFDNIPNSSTSTKPSAIRHTIPPMPIPSPTRGARSV